MPQIDIRDFELWFLVVIAIAIFVFLTIGGFCFLINDFFIELKFINIEIRRSTGSERKFWIRRRRKLWLSLLLPFVKY